MDGERKKYLKKTVVKKGGGKRGKRRRGEREKFKSEIYKIRWKVGKLSSEQEGECVVVIIQRSGLCCALDGLL